MPFRFNRRLPIAPGLTLNLGKRGASVSAGETGAKITVGPRGVRRTIGVPGTGLSHTELVTPDETPEEPAPAADALSAWHIIVFGLVALVAFLYEILK